MIHTATYLFARICSTKGDKKKFYKFLLFSEKFFLKKIKRSIHNFRKKRQGGKAVPGLANIVKGAKKGVNRGKARNKKGGYKSKAKNAME